MKSWITRWLNSSGNTHVLSLVRIGIGLLLFWLALVAAREFARIGYFGDVFHLPFVPESFVPSRGVYMFLVTSQLILAALVTVGHRARQALFFAGIVGVYLLLCDRLHFHHNRYALYIYAWLLSFTPCDQSLRISSENETLHTGSLWAVRLMQVQCSIIYLASGLAKLFDPDWRNGVVIFDRFARYGYQARDRGIPESVIRAFSRLETTSVLAKIAIATELFLAIGLWNKRTRIFALWCGVVFHLTIEGSSQVEGFTWLTLLIYGLFATHDFHARKVFWDPSRWRGRFYGRLIRALDWLGRFEVKPWQRDPVRGGHHIVVVDRDGRRYTGFAALIGIARTCPLIFPLWLPLALVNYVTSRSDRATP